jgi:hypothetical protein
MLQDLVRRDLERVPGFEVIPCRRLVPSLGLDRVGSYRLLERLMKSPKEIFSARSACKMPAPPDLRGRQPVYFFAVRYSDTFIRRDDYSPTRYLMLQYAEADYFKSAESDALFGYRRGHEGDPQKYSDVFWSGPAEAGLCGLEVLPPVLRSVVVVTGRRRRYTVRQP